MRAGALLFMGYERARFGWDLVTSLRADINNTAGKTTRRNVKPIDLHPLRKRGQRIMADDLKNLPFDKMFSSNA